LLQGNLQLESLRAEALQVSTVNWPSSGPDSTDKAPYDYRNLDRWLPRRLQLGTLALLTGADAPISVSALRGYRHNNSVTLEWETAGAEYASQASLTLESLDRLLALEQFDAQLALNSDNPDLPDSRLAVAVRDQPDQGYQLVIDGDLAGMSLKLEAAGREPWTAPTRSRAQFDALYPERLLMLAEAVAASPTVKQGQPFLSRPLPTLALPQHEAVLEAATLKIRDRQAFHDMRVIVEARDSLLRLKALKLGGLYARLDASGELDTAADGWALAIDSEIVADAAAPGILNQYNDSPVQATSGRLVLHTRGGTPQALLNQLSGDFDIEGVYRGAQETPLTLAGTLDRQPDIAALDSLRLRAGDSEAAGKLVYVPDADGGELSLSLSAETLALDFLELPASDPDSNADSGIPLPAFLGTAPELRLKLDVEIARLEAGGYSAADIVLALDRGEHDGSAQLALRGPLGGSLKLALDYRRDDAGDLGASAQIQSRQLHPLELLRLDSGAVSARFDMDTDISLSGTSWADALDAMQATTRIDVEARRDGDWGRDTRDDERFNFALDWSSAVRANRVVGATVQALTVESAHQRMTGSGSLLMGRRPLLQAELAAHTLDLDRILAWLPADAKAEPDADLLTRLRKLPSADISARVDSLAWNGLDIERLNLETRLAADSLEVPRLDFALQGASIAGGLGLDWNRDIANLKVTGRVEDLDLRRILQSDRDLPPEVTASRLAGSLALEGTGAELPALIRSLSGEVQLEDAQTSGDAERLDVAFQRQQDAGLVSIRQLRLAGSELQGDIRITPGDVDRYDIRLAGTSLNLLPWQQALQRARESTGRARADNADPLAQTAGFTRGLLGFATKVLTGAQAGAKDTRIFDREPLDLEPLTDNNLQLDLRFEQVATLGQDMRSAHAIARVGAGRFALDAEAAELNGGPARLNIRFDGNTEPYQLALDFDARGIHREKARGYFPLFTDIRLLSEGRSEAELAANLNGVAYVELGAGPINIGSVALINADIATAALRTLIPGVKSSETRLKCGVSVAQAKDGHLNTPFGYVVQTGTANLLGGIDIDLEKEWLKARFESRSREGVGISLGNAFSGAVAIEGPLSEPELVPNTSGMLLRGWAAFATGGLSLVGESMFKRVLASAKPCRSSRQEIRENLCGGGLPLGNSPLACRPDDQPASEAPLRTTTPKPTPAA
ncbi:MAG: hypothetical protein V2J89_02945, partial [Halieaceae bacterium]|nr:hypothetical protein [Halieaceae bacterium]